MPCVHLRELYELCEKHDLCITSHDAIHIVCRQCEEQDVCPSSLTDGENVLQMPKDDGPIEPVPGDFGGGNDAPSTENTASPEKRPR